MFSLNPANGPALVNSNWDISGLWRRTCGLTAMATGFGDGAMLWSGLPDGPVTVTVEREDEILWSGEAEVTEGLASLRIPVAAVRSVRLRIGCDRAEAGP